MSEIKIFRNNKNEITQVYLMDVTLFYTNIQSPRPVFKDRDLNPKDAEKEFSVVAAITEDIADEWDEIFTKQPSAKLTNAKFREKYRLEEDDELPVADAKKQFTVKVAQHELDKDGNQRTGKARPRVVVPQTITEGKTTRKILKDITFESLVGNGSKGNVAIRVAKNSFGTFAYLDKVIVTDLVEYQAAGDGLSQEEAELLGVDDIEYADVNTSTTTSRKEEEEDDTPDDDTATTTVPSEF